MNTKELLIGAALGVAGFVAYSRYLSRKLSGTGTAPDPAGPPAPNQAASPRLPGLPTMPAFPSPPSWAVPNMPAGPAPAPSVGIPPRTAPPVETGFIAAPDVFAGGPGWRNINDWTTLQ